MSQAPADGDPVEWPSVSVVIPTVNRVEELARAVRSVLDQDYPGFVECIVVFDGTVPTTPDVPVPDNRELRLAVNSRTKGLAGNRNSGLDLAVGDYVAHCDDDDEWLPEVVPDIVEVEVAVPRLRSAAW